MLKRIKPHSDENWRYRTGDIVVDSTEATGRAIVKYILSGRFPETDKVDVSFLEAAWTLQLWHLILYAEQALVWNLKPTNVVAIATYGFFNSHAWLVWASAQYLKFHLDLVNSTDQEWKNLPPKYLQILIREMRYKFEPCLLPTISNSSGN
uniref:Uncharacterized protein n=1 Tax=Lygus hesperus TaxID=30085 RepID=A0A0K8SV85_LYGHE